MRREALGLRARGVDPEGEVEGCHAGLWGAEVEAWVGGCEVLVVEGGEEGEEGEGDGGEF